MSVLSEIRGFPETVRVLARATSQVAQNLGELVELQAQNGSADARLEELERSRARWEAEVEALLLKADSTLKSASNAESRSRTMVRHAEKLVDPFDDEGEAGEEAVSRGDDPRVEETGVLHVPLELATNDKTHALRAKWLM